MTPPPDPTSRMAQIRRLEEGGHLDERQNLADLFDQFGDVTEIKQRKEEALDRRNRIMFGFDDDPTDLTLETVVECTEE